MEKSQSMGCRRTTRFHLDSKDRKDRHVAKLASIDPCSMHWTLDSIQTIPWKAHGSEYQPSGFGGSVWSFAGE